MNRDNVDQFRLGGLAIGYKMSFTGINLERIRHGFQNWFAHHIVKPQPAFLMLDRKIHFYAPFYPLSNQYTLW